MAAPATAMSIEHCFDHGTVIFELLSADKFGALRELIRRAPVFREIGNLDPLEEAVITRERLQSTDLGHGVAVAHGRAAGVQRVLISLGLSRAGIPCASPDGEPVRLLFVIASPLHVSLDYLHSLSTLVRCLRDRSVRESLLEGIDAEEVQRRIREAFLIGLARSADQVIGRPARGAVC
jgi:PTS system nitrogen regulatory IIA component